MRFIIFVFLSGALLIQGSLAGEATSPIGLNTFNPVEEAPIPTAFVDSEDSRFDGIHHSGELNRPMMDWIAGFPRGEPGQWQLLVPEEEMNFRDRYLRSSHIFSEIEPPSPMDLNISGNGLALGQALRLALAQNMDVQIVRMEKEIQQARVTQAMGTFDPTWEISTTFEVLNRPQNTQEFLSTGGSPFDPEVGTGEPRRFEDNNQRYALTLTGKIPQGTTYEMNLRMDVLDNTLTRTSDANIYDPEYSIRQLREIQAQLGESLDTLLHAEQRFESHRRAILRLISSSADPDYNRNFIPVGQMRTELPELNEASLFQNALQFRADYLQSQKELELDEIELDFVRNQAKPRLDFVTSTGFNGLEGDAYNAFAVGPSEPYVDFTVGLIISRPWNNSQARARVREIRKRRMQSVMEIRRLEHDTSFQIRTAVDSLEQLKRRLEASIKIREYFEIEVEEEELQLEKGNRSIYDTLQFYSDLSDAKTRELSILTEMNKALVQLYTVDGSLLNRLGIELVDY